MIVTFTKEDMILWGQYLLSEQRRENTPEEFWFEVSMSELDQYVVQFWDKEMIKTYDN